MKTIRLYNDVEMPILGFGVFQIPDAEECEKSVFEAIEAGYRLMIRLKLIKTRKLLVKL